MNLLTLLGEQLTVPEVKFVTHKQLATAFPLMNLMNDDGQPLFRLPHEERLPVFSPQYSRSTLMTHMLCEILAHPDFNAAFRHAETGARNFPPANV